MSDKPLVLTKYERTRIIGERATQIAYGANPLIDFDPKMRPEEIAEAELDAGKTPMTLTRTMPDGKKVQYDLQKCLKTNQEKIEVRKV